MCGTILTYPLLAAAICPKRCVFLKPWRFERCITLVLVITLALHFSGDYRIRGHQASRCVVRLDRVSSFQISGKLEFLCETLNSVPFTSNVVDNRSLSWRPSKQIARVRCQSSRYAVSRWCFIVFHFAAPKI